MQTNLGNLGARIVVIDDDPLASKVTTKILKSKGYETFAFNDPSAAYQFVNEEEVDLILCDLAMPNLDGVALLEMTRSLPKMNQVPFLFLTSIDNGEEISRCYHAGGDDYLIKPIPAETLVMIVKNRLERYRSMKQVGNDALCSYSKKIIQTLSHEFRTPLVSLMTGSELLETEINNLKGDIDRSAHQRMTRILTAVKNGSQRLEQLINDFLLMQQIQNGALTWYLDSPPIPLSTSALLQRYYIARREYVESNGFKIIFDRNNFKETEIIATEPQVFSILDRFLNNAMKFSDQQKEAEAIKELILVCEEDEKYGILGIKDRGKGLPSSYRSDHFEPFQQVNRETQEQQGSGLGLVIASQLAALLGGKVSLAKRNAGGACAYLYLPKYNEQPQQNEPK